jgi:hypothetical protein
MFIYVFSHSNISIIHSFMNYHLKTTHNPLFYIASHDTKIYYLRYSLTYTNQNNPLIPYPIYSHHTFIPLIFHHFPTYPSYHDSTFPLIDYQYTLILTPENSHNPIYHLRSYDTENYKFDQPAILL